MVCKKCNSELSEDSRFCSNCGKRVSAVISSKQHKQKVVKTVTIIVATLICIAAIIAVLYFQGNSYTLEMDYSAKEFIHFVDGIERYGTNLKTSIVDIESMPNNSAKVTVGVVYADYDPTHIIFDFSNDLYSYDLTISADILDNYDKAQTVMQTCMAIEMMLADYSYINTDFNKKFGTVKYSSDLESNYKLNSKYNVSCTYKNNLRNSDSFIYTISSLLV